LLHVAVHYTGAPDEAARLEEMLRTTYDCVESFVAPFTPVMSGYVGPGLLGVAFYADAVAHAE
jgi:fatty acid-binding protein DegV